MFIFREGLWRMTWCWVLGFVDAGTYVDWQLWFIDGFRRGVEKVPWLLLHSTGLRFGVLEKLDRGVDAI